MTHGGHQADRATTLLVGSLPFETVDEAMREAGLALGGELSALPDGEVGPRKTWTGFLATDIFPLSPDLEVIHAPRALAQPGDMEHIEEDDRPPTFRVKEGVDNLRFDDLGYGRFAIESYATFKELRADGVIADDVRFQVCLPSPASAIICFFSEVDQWPQVMDAYATALKGELARLLEEIPASDLAVQIDYCAEVIDIARGGKSYPLFPFWPDERFEDKFERYAAQFSYLGEGVPDEAVFGYHWCYGTWGGWPMTAMNDLALCVRLSNEVARRAPRRIDYVHMPVVAEPDASFFAALANLDTDDTYVYLGLVHHEDGVAGFNRRADLAREVLDAFGIAAVCGYGRVHPSELRAALSVHREAAEELRRMNAQA